MEIHRRGRKIGECVIALTSLAAAEIFLSFRGPLFAGCCELTVLWTGNLNTPLRGECRCDPLGLAELAFRSSQAAGPVGTVQNGRFDRTHTHGSQICQVYLPGDFEHDLPVPCALHPLVLGWCRRWVRRMSCSSQRGRSDPRGSSERKCTTKILGRSALGSTGKCLTWYSTAYSVLRYLC